MIEHSPHAGIKSEVMHLWNHNRPLAVTILVGFGILAYYLYKQGTGGITAPANTTTGASGVPASWSNTYVTNNKTVNVSSPSPVTPGPTPTPTPGQPPPGPVPGNPIPQPGRITPIIPYNTFTTHQFPTQPGNPYANVSTYAWQGTTYKVMPGSNGLVWGQPVNGGAQVLLYGPASAY